MLDSPDTPVQLVPVRAYRCVGGAMIGSTSVVVDCRLVVEVQDIHCSVGTCTQVHRAEPKISLGEKLGLARFAGIEGDSLGAQAVPVHQVYRGLANKMISCEFRGPGSATLN